MLGEVFRRGQYREDVGLCYLGFIRTSNFLRAQGKVNMERSAIRQSGAGSGQRYRHTEICRLREQDYWLAYHRYQ